MQRVTNTNIYSSKRQPGEAPPPGPEWQKGRSLWLCRSPTGEDYAGLGGMYSPATEAACFQDPQDNHILQLKSGVSQLMQIFYSARNDGPTGNQVLSPEGLCRRQLTLNCTWQSSGVIETPRAVEVGSSCCLRLWNKSKSEKESSMAKQFTSGTRGTLCCYRGCFRSALLATSLVGFKKELAQLMEVLRINSY